MNKLRKLLAITAIFAVPILGSAAGPAGADCTTWQSHMIVSNENGTTGKTVVAVPAPSDVNVSDCAFDGPNPPPPPTVIIMGN